MQTAQDRQDSVVDKYKKVKRLKKLSSLIGGSGVLVIGVAILSLVVLIGIFGGEIQKVLRLVVG